MVVASIHLYMFGALASTGSGLMLTFEKRRKVGDGGDPVLVSALVVMTKIDDRDSNSEMHRLIRKSISIKINLLRYCRRLCTRINSEDINFESRNRSVHYPKTHNVRHVCRFSYETSRSDAIITCIPSHIRLKEQRRFGEDSTHASMPLYLVVCFTSYSPIVLGLVWRITPSTSSVSTTIWVPTPSRKSAAATLFTKTTPAC
jgi:hypothetical protein